MKNNDIIKSSLLSPVKELITDISDMGLNEIIGILLKEQKLLKDIPFIKWIFIGNDIRSIIQSAFFIKKYSNFVGAMNELMKEEFLNNNKLKEIFSNDKIFSQIIDQTMISLDKYQTITKAKILGLLFVETFKNINFSLDEYNTLCFSIEFIHPTLGFECLKSFYKYKCEMNNEEDKELKDKIWMNNSSVDYSPLANTSLLILPNGGMYCGNYGGAFINKLGYKFYELVVSKI
jgi:hypothetical protein